MTITLATLFGLLGLAIGSFLNVCIDRLPAKRSLVYPSSHCDACQHPLSVLDLIPGFSFLWLRGRCRHCGARISRRVFWVEAITGFLFVFVFLFYGLTVQMAITIVYFCVLLLLAMIDLEQGLLLNVIIYPAIAVVFIINMVAPDVVKDVKDIYPPGTGILKGLAGGAAGFFILLFIALIFRSGMGWGDVKMAGLIGLMAGFPRVLVVILGSIVLGGLSGIFLILFKKKGRKDTVPFGPFLTLSAILALLWGIEIIKWYLKLFSRG